MKLARYKRIVGISLATAIIIVIAAAFFSPWALTLRNADTGRLYARWPIKEGGVFSVEFVHSVNQTPVREIFSVRGGRIVPVETVFYGFGAGMQTELEGNQQLKQGENGEMSIIGFDMQFAKLEYIVGTVSDHLLAVGEDNVSLRELCGRNAAVTLKAEKTIFLLFSP